MSLKGRGRNDGAWYRANKFIKSLRGPGAPSGDNLQALADRIVDIESLDPYIAALQDNASAAGVPFDEEEFSNVVLATQWATTGIPRQVWNGVMPYDQYVPGTLPGSLKKKHAQVARDFASDLREAVEGFKLSMRQLQDVANLGARNANNPGGIADATQNN